MTQEGENLSEKPTLIDQGKKIADLTERASSAAESASTVFQAVKWVAIAVVTLTFAGGIYGTYKVISAPAKAVGSAAGAVGDTVKRGTNKIKQGGTDIMSRLEIETTRQDGLNKLADKAFSTLSDMDAVEPADIKERVFWRTQFPGHEGRICKFSLDFGHGDVPVMLAIDYEAFATAKALGATEGRLIRMLITAGEEDIALRLDREAVGQNWVMKWRVTTLKKPVSDAVAEASILDILKTSAKICQNHT